MSAIGTPLNDFVSIGRNLASRAAAKPNAPAITCAGTTLTFLELHARTNRMARGLLEKGVMLGDFVTIGLPNSIGFIEASYACWKIGAVPQPVSWRLPLHEIKAIVDLANPKVVINAAAIELDRPVIAPDDLLNLSADASDLPDAISPTWKAPTSGGSTGRPKLIVSGQPGVTAAGEGGERALWRLSQTDVALMTGPLYHNAPFGLSAAALQAGAHLILMTKFDAEECLKLIQEYRVSWLYLVPTMMSRIWRVPGREKFDVSSLKTMWHMAAPCPPWLKEEWINWIGGETILELYGGTEAQAITIIAGNEWMAHKGSVGKVFGPGEMKAFSPVGNPLGPGEIGEIYIKRDPSLPPSYRYVGAEARTLPGGWESLGDIGWLDEEGYLYLADRRTDMILVGGANVYPAEIEAALDEHPLVASSAVIGLPHEELGNQIHAIIQPRAGLSEEELHRHLADRLVSYKRPRTFEFVAENVRDDAGKVRRTALRDARLGKVPRKF
ncbi:MAG TPA: AMP-binding protein [Rhizomicrobium sp.]|nr:AMP-binding protein [Rhizomicrobium sp.]